METANSQTMRYLAASILQNRSFRQKVLDLVEAEQRALAPELDFDLEILAKLSHLMQARDKRYNWIFFFVMIVAVIMTVVSKLIWGIIIFFLGSWLVHLVKSIDLRYKLIPSVRRDTENLKGLEHLLETQYPFKGLPKPIPDKQQNLVVYSGFSPFVGTGIFLDGWSFPVTITQPKEEWGKVLDIIPFELTELYDAIEQALKGNLFEGFATRDMLFVNGKQIRDERWILPSIYTNPVDYVDTQRFEEYREKRDPLIRFYKRIYAYDRGREIAVSIFFRISRSGAHLYVEANRFMLTPVADEYRNIDTILPPSSWTLIWLFLRSALSGVFVAAISPVAILWNLFTAIRDSNLFGLRERNKRRRTEADLYHDYGAQTSIREQVSSNEYGHYFQMLDKEMFVKIFDKQLLNTITNFLDAHNIDTSDMRERQTTILNSGVIVQGGEVKAESMSVGTGSSATVRRN